MTKGTSDSLSSSVQSSTQVVAGVLPASPKRPYRELDPLEEGGRTARDGFDYQDHIAVNKCLDMLLGSELSEVWCEAEDDVVLVWSSQGREEFEFVQVKGTDLKQAWTVAKLCTGEQSKDGKKKRSIVEKSLAHDRGCEECRFRVVTRWEPDTVLEVLFRPLSSRNDSGTVSSLSNVAKEIEKNLGKVTSPNGNDLKFWIDRTVWEHRASVRDVKNDSLVKISRLLELLGEYLAPDQCEELHANLYNHVQSASLASGITAKDMKRLRRDELRTWLQNRVNAIQHPTHSGGNGPLCRKLREAGVSPDSVEAASDLRRRYLAEARLPKYLTVDDRESFEAEVLAVLHRVKSRLDAGELPDDGRRFLVHCQAELIALRDRMTGTKPPESIMYGYMYEVMNRCLHRLVRVAT